MAKVVTGLERAAGGLVLPRSRQSRVVSVELHIPAGIGASDFAYTPALGNVVWLLNVTALFFRNHTGGQIGGFVYIGTGSGVPASGEVIATQWQLIIPNYHGAKAGLWWQGVEANFSWDMSRLYTGEGRRFGVSIENFSATLNWVAVVTFLISEG